MPSFIITEKKQKISAGQRFAEISKGLQKISSVHLWQILADDYSLSSSKRRIRSCWRDFSERFDTSHYRFRLLNQKIRKTNWTRHFSSFNSSVNSFPCHPGSRQLGLIYSTYSGLFIQIAQRLKELLCVCVRTRVCLFPFRSENLYICRGKRAVLARWPWRGPARVITAARWTSLNSSLKASGQESLRAVYTLYGKWLRIEPASVRVFVRGLKRPLSHKCSLVVSCHLNCSKFCILLSLFLLHFCCNPFEILKCSLNLAENAWVHWLKNCLTNITRWIFCQLANW